MRFVATDIPGVTIVGPEPHIDDRGSFARLYCPVEFAKAGIDFHSRQISVSRNPAPLTLRGMHFQDPPYAEGKLVRVSRGRVFDVVIDLRAQSPAYCHWTGVELDANAMTGLYIPPGCAHGFLTLERDTDVIYQIDRDHVPGVGRGVRWNDPLFGIVWPAVPDLVSQRDESWPDYKR